MKKLSIIQTQKSELGQALVARAEEKLRADTQQMFQNEVNDVVRKIDECKRTIRLAEAGLKHFEAQQAALESGKFEFHPWRKTIVYKEKALNQSYQDPDYPHLKV